MAATETEAAHPSGDSGLFRASITEDFTSSTSEAASSRLHDADAGHERLLKHTASNDGKAITHCRPSRPPHYLLLAILVSFVNLPFGLLGITFSLLSKSRYRTGKHEDAKHWGCVSKWLSIIGLAVSAVVLGFVIVYFVHIDKNIVDTPEELNSA